MKQLLFVVNDAAFFLAEPLQLALAAQAQGYSVGVITPDGAACGEILTKGFRIHRVPLSRGSMAPRTELRTLAALLRLYRQERPTLVHHLGIKAILHGGVAARLATQTRAVHVVTGRGHLFVGRGMKLGLARSGTVPLLRWVLGNPRSVTLFLNAEDRDEWVRTKLVAPQRAAVVHAFGVDCDKFRPSDETVEPALVMLPARMLWTKGVGEFVEAARQLQAAGSHARFALVGKPDPDNPASIPEGQLRRWAQEQVVEWWGFQSDMPAVYAQASIVCLPSYSEGLPRALLEAAASGKPIVASAVPGCREVVRDGENGLLVPPRDATSLAQALRQLLAAPARRREMGRAGRERALRDFSKATGIDEVLTVYRKLLERVD